MKSNRDLATLLQFPQLEFIRRLLLILETLGNTFISWNWVIKTIIRWSMRLRRESRKAERGCCEINFIRKCGTVRSTKVLQTQRLWFGQSSWNTLLQRTQSRNSALVRKKIVLILFWFWSGALVAPPKSRIIAACEETYACWFNAVTPLKYILLLVLYSYRSFAFHPGNTYSKHTNLSLLTCWLWFNWSCL